MDLNTTFNRQSLINNFPKLSGDSNFIIKSPTTSIYNCIAFAMGMEDRWVDWNIKCPGHWWPAGVPCSEAPDSLIKAFEALGFEKCSNDKLEEGYDKVALYKNDDNKWTHAARIIDSGIYHSKFGQSYDATHSGGDILDSAYGNIYYFMRRNWTYKIDTIIQISNDNLFQKVNLPGVPFELYIFKGDFYDKHNKRVYLYPIENGQIEISYDPKK